jgi:hypothetical protein
MHELQPLRELRFHEDGVQVQVPDMRRSERQVRMRMEAENLDAEVPDRLSAAAQCNDTALGQGL